MRRTGVFWIFCKEISVWCIWLYYLVLHQFSVVFRAKNEKTYFDDSLLTYVKTGNIDEIQSISEERISLSLVDASGSTLLHYATKFNNVSMVQFFIDSKYDVNAVDNFGYTPLLLAVKADNMKIAKILLNADAKTDILGSDGKNLFIEAFLTSNHKLELIKIIIDKIKNGCSYNEQLLVQKLLKLKFTLAQAIFLRDLRLTKMMLQYGYSELINDGYGEQSETALHVAVFLNDLPTVRLLLKHGADVNASDKHGFTPVRNCINFKKETLIIFRTLVEHGAATSLIEGEVGRLSTEFLLLLGREPTVHALLLEYVSLSSTDLYGRTPLHYLIINPNHNSLDCVRGERFDVNVPDNFGNTLLHRAVAKGCVKKVQFLLENDAVVNIANEVQRTPLALAVWSTFKMGSKKIVQLLLQYGADSQEFDNDGDAYLWSSKFYVFFQPLLAHLAMIECQGQILTEATRGKINSNEMFQTCFAKCRHQLVDMQNIRVYESVTLYKLLVEDPIKIARYARSQTFIANFKDIMKNKRRAMDAYYLCTLHKKVGKSIQTARSKWRAAFMVSQITNLSIDNYYSLIYKVANYLDTQDLRNMLCVCEDFETGSFNLDKFF